MTMWLETLAKKVEDMDYYELLNLRLDASAEEMKRAYIFALDTYGKDFQASYGLVPEEERLRILERVEEAFRTLTDPKKRKLYDLSIFSSRPESRQKAYFRKSTERLEIADAGDGAKRWGGKRNIFASIFKKKD